MEPTETTPSGFAVEDVEVNIMLEWREGQEGVTVSFSKKDDAVPVGVKSHLSGVAVNVVRGIFNHKKLTFPSIPSQYKVRQLEGMGQDLRHAGNKVIPTHTISCEICKVISSQPTVRNKRLVVFVSLCIKSVNMDALTNALAAFGNAVNMDALTNVCLCPNT